MDFYSVLLHSAYRAYNRTLFRIFPLQREVKDRHREVSISNGVYPSEPSIPYDPYSRRICEPIVPAHALYRQHHPTWLPDIPLHLHDPLFLNHLLKAKRLLRRRTCPSGLTRQISENIHHITDGQNRV